MAETASTSGVEGPGGSAGSLETSDFLPLLTHRNPWSDVHQHVRSVRCLFVLIACAYTAEIWAVFRRPSKTYETMTEQGRRIIRRIGAGWVGGCVALHSPLALFYHYHYIPLLLLLITVCTWALWCAMTSTSFSYPWAHPVGEGVDPEHKTCV